MTREQELYQEELRRLYAQFDALMPVNSHLWRPLDVLRDLNERITRWKEARSRRPWEGIEL